MDIFTEIESFVRELFVKDTSDKLFFHKIKHTLDVVEASKKIGEESGLSKDEMEILLISAWFHDTGYITKYKQHEDISINIAEKFLASKDYDSVIIEKVIENIAATEVPQKPKNIMEKVLCDADMIHLSQEDFCEKTEKLRKELKLNTDKSLSKKKYYKITIDFFVTHKYHTEYGKETLSNGKEKNLKKLRKRLKELDIKKKEKKKKKNINQEKEPDNIEKLKMPTRGVETMFRTTANNQISLSSIADNKANILITINSIVLSVIITLLFSQFGDYPMIVVPTVVLLISSLLTIILSILATRPEISSGKFTKVDILNKKVNILFFGNFYNMSLEDYEWAVMEMMKDYERLYGNLIKDQYFLGKVLAEKYKRIRNAYTVFMYGMILSVFAFLVTVVFF